jgi:hypothetical protein
LKFISSILFEWNTHLRVIASEAPSKSPLQSVLIPSNGEILDSQWFSDCNSFSSITFESNSRLTDIKSESFSESSLQ